ncbi:uncharacterized protein lrif1 [Pholidichthys leucotaenia]
MEPAHSGTGVFYQAMPAIGADGKNIMKLIPVQMVNGKFVQTEMHKPITNPAPPKAVSTNSATGPIQKPTQTTLSPVLTQQIINKSLGHSKAPNKQPQQQQQTVNLMAKVAPMATTNCGTSVSLSHHLPVTVNSPALPRGQHLQIPPNAQVQTVPASQLPPSIKNQIFGSSAGSFPVSSVDNVLYVSPVTTVSQSMPPPSDSALDSVKLLTKTSPRLPSKAAKPKLKLIPQVPHVPHCPIRWVVEEVDTPATPDLKLPSSPSVTSKILQAVAKRESADKQHSIVAKAATTEGDGVQRKGSALVMCNGKVFFVSEKENSTFQTMATSKSSKSDKTVVNFQQLLEDPHESAEVIDLCDDDALDDSPPKMATENLSAASHLDEDNVIFVSYIPPKTESCALQDVTQTVQERLKKPDWQTDSSTGLRGQSTSVRNDTHVCGSAVIDVNDRCGTSIRSSQRTSIQQSAEPGCSFQAEKIHRVVSSLQLAPILTAPQEPKTSQVSDHALRQTFGITAEVSIGLHRIDEVAAGSGPAEHLRIESIWSLVDNEKPASTEKLLLQDLHPTGEPATTHLGCSSFKLDTESPFTLKYQCHSGESSLQGTTADPGIGYMGPIDEDFLTAQEGTAVAQATCVDVSTSPRRMGRTRKRTTCPCCIPSALEPAVKYSPRVEEPGKLALTAEHALKKGQRTNTLRKDGRIGCLSARNKPSYRIHEASVSNRGSTASMDLDEFTTQEQIRRLKELLKEKEKALELLRKSMS